MPNAKMNCFVDTNVLVYATDEANPKKRARAQAWLDALGDCNALVLSPQCVNEFYHVACRRFPGIARKDVLQVCEMLLAWCTATLDVHTIRRAWSIEKATGFQWFDCLLLASAAIARCHIFLSEDLQHERVIEDLRIIDPFKILPDDINSMN